LKIQNNLQWTIQFDAAGACPATYTKNTHDREWGTPVYDDATLIPYSRNIPSRAQLDYDPTKGEFQESV
jgi:hypothetical protein